MESRSSLSDEATAELMVRSIKADYTCGQVRKMFNLCRASPFGKVVDPSYWKFHGSNLIKCYNDLVLNEGQCKELLTEAQQCILENKDANIINIKSCARSVDAYVSWINPIDRIYSKYEQKYAGEVPKPEQNTN